MLWWKFYYWFYTQPTSKGPLTGVKWEVLGQSQSWSRMMQTDLWKLYDNSRIFEFATACPKIKIFRMRKNMIVFL